MDADDSPIEVALGSSYVLGTRLGRGSMGVVYEGRNRNTGESVAIKVLRHELADDPEIVARFVQERSILMKVDSPNVVKIRDLVVEGSELAIVMELVPGGTTLRSVLRSTPTLPPADACHLMIQVLDGLAAVHGCNVVHRDLKPENILVDVSNDRLTAKLTDFGISRITTGSTITRMTGLIGSPDYLCPEALGGARPTPAADVYAAGILCYELLSGRTPFSGGDMFAVLLRHREEEPPEIQGIPRRWWELIDAMLAKSPEARPSIQVARNELASIAPRTAGLPALAPIDEWRTDQSMSTTARIATPPVSRTTLPGTDDATIETVLKVRTQPSANQSATAERPRRRHSHAALLAIPGVAVVSLVAILAVGTLTGNRNDSINTASASEYRLPTIEYNNGVVASQFWRYSSNRDRIDAHTTIENGGSSKAIQAFDLVVPKGIARSVRQVNFSPNPDFIVRRDPVVRYCINLQPGEKIAITYRADLVEPPESNPFRTWSRQWKNDVADLDGSGGTACIGTSTAQPSAKLDASAEGIVNSPNGSATGSPSGSRSSGGGSTEASGANRSGGENSSSSGGSSLDSTANSPQQRGNGSSPSSTPPNSPRTTTARTTSPPATATPTTSPPTTSPPTTTPPTTKPPQSCSKTDGTAVSVRILNRRSTAIDLYWVNPDCNEVFYVTIPAGYEVRQDTYRGHEWRAREHSGQQLVGQFVADPSTPVVNFD